MKVGQNWRQSLDLSQTEFQKNILVQYQTSVQTRETFESRLPATSSKLIDKLTHYQSIPTHQDPQAAQPKAS